MISFRSEIFHYISAKALGFRVQTKITLLCFTMTRLCYIFSMTSRRPLCLYDKPINYSLSSRHVSDVSSIGCTHMCHALFYNGCFDWQSCVGGSRFPRDDDVRRNLSFTSYDDHNGGDLLCTFPGLWEAQWLGYLI